MAEHGIRISKFPEVEVKAKDVEFEIRSGDKLLGKLGVSKGTLTWTPSWGKPRHIEWEKLDQISELWTDTI